MPSAVGCAVSPCPPQPLTSLLWQHRPQGNPTVQGIYSKEQPGIQHSSGITEERCSRRQNHVHVHESTPTLPRHFPDWIPDINQWGITLLCVKTLCCSLTKESLLPMARQWAPCTSSRLPGSPWGHAEGSMRRINHFQNPAPSVDVAVWVWQTLLAQWRLTEVTALPSSAFCLPAQHCLLRDSQVLQLFT